MAKTFDALKILEKSIAPTKSCNLMVAEASINAHVAKLIYEVKAGLTQQQLADLSGTKQPVIARLEDADYEGHSLSMLQRIAHALNQRLKSISPPLSDIELRAQSS